MSEMGGAGDVGGERDRVGEHFRLFNEAVRRNDWTDFIATFAPDAVMTFEGVPVGPYAGRDAIAEAYATQPPTDTMSCVSDDRDGDTDVVRFAWDAGGYGTLRVSWRGGAVATLTITFDQLPDGAHKGRCSSRTVLIEGGA